MKKIGNLIKRHKILFSFCSIVLIAIIIMSIIFLKMTINTKGKYGDRLEGIEKVEISKDTLTDISSQLEEKEEVNKAKLRNQGKIIYIDISFTKNTTLDKGKEIASSVINKFSTKELEFYDLSFIINQISENEEDEVWATAGAKNSNEKEISWTRS